MDALLMVAIAHALNLLDSHLATRVTTLSYMDMRVAVGLLRCACPAWQSTGEFHERNRT